MRLGLVRHKYQPGGGAERTLWLLAQGLAQRGHEVFALVSAWEGETPAGVKLETLPANRYENFAAQVPARLAELKLDSTLSLERVPGVSVYRAGDGVHAAWLKRRAAYEGALRVFARRFSTKHQGLLKREALFYASPGLKKVIANSHLVARELEEYFGLGPERVEVLYNGVDANKFNPPEREVVRAQTREELGLSPDQPAFLFLGGGFERKGLAFALAALARLPEATLLVAGGDRIARFAAQARRLDVANRVRFLGRRGDAPRLLQAADALLLPTIYDPCANACLEGLVAGTPVVTTSANGAGELVDEGVNGLVVAEPADDKALAVACEQALALKGPFDHRVPGLEQWLARIISILESTGGEDS